MLKLDYYRNLKLQFEAVSLSGAQTRGTNSGFDEATGQHQGSCVSESHPRLSMRRQGGEKEGLPSMKLPT